MHPKEPENLKVSVLNWLESLRIKDAPYGTYRMSRSTEASIFSSCFAIFVRELYNDLKNVSQEQKYEWIDLIQRTQDPRTGFFVDLELRKSKLFSENLGTAHDWGYVTWQSTTFCISALNVLGQKPEYPFRFLEKWKNASRVTAWLEKLNWKTDVWTAGNLAMFLGVCLITDHEKNQDKKTRDAIEAFFDWHDKFQDLKTGFWGTNCGAPIHLALFGAMHQYLLYYYINRPLNYMENIVDNVLLVQQPDGLFSPIGGGGACEDYDAVDTLVNLYWRTNYRRNGIKESLSRVLIATVNTQGEDGGFLWAKRHPFRGNDWFRIVTSITRHRNFNYWCHSLKEAVMGQFIRRDMPRLSKGWTKSGIPTTESDIFSTWFRSLNLALISKLLTKNPYSEIEWRFLKGPGLGYFDESIMRI